MLYRQTSLGVAKLHQQRARLCLGDPLEVLDAVVAVVHVEVRDADAAVEHGKVAGVDRDDAAARQLAAQLVGRLSFSGDLNPELRCASSAMRSCRAPPWSEAHRSSTNLLPRLNSGASPAPTYSLSRAMNGMR